ncbi:MAG: hypothetical protein R6V08_10725 [Desulfuromonadales bacterium]
MENKITIALEIKSGDLKKEIETILGEVSDLAVKHWQDGVGEKGKAATSVQPDIILVEDVPASGPVKDRVKALRGNYPDAVVFVVSPDPRPEHIVEAMKAGAREYLVSPIKKKVLENAVDEVRSSLANSGKMGRGRTYSFIGSKGGLGTTFLAVNTAVAMSENDKTAVSMVDMSCQSGDAAVLLDLKPGAGLADLARNFHRLDISLLRGTMKKHSSGLQFLGAPVQPEMCEDIKPEHVRKVLELLEKMSNQIVVDCHSMFVNDNAVESFKKSEKVFIVTELTIPSIRNAVRLLNVMQEVGIEKKRIEVVVNRFEKSYSLSIEEAEKSLKKRIFWLFPNHHQDVMTSINRGVPLLNFLPHCQLSTNISSFAERLVDPGKIDNFRGARGMFGQAI